LPTNLHQAEQVKFVTDLFDSHDEHPVTGRMVGGEKKKLFLMGGDTLDFPHHPPITRLVREMKTAFMPRYNIYIRQFYPGWEEKIDSADHFLKQLNNALQAGDWKGEDTKLPPDVILRFKDARGTKRKPVDESSKEARKSSRYLFSTWAGQSSRGGQSE
jgi:hypothetical protein